MSVKRSQTASRVLAVLEAVARHQPVGVSELARTLGADKSAIQRAVMTLADDGWIVPVPEGPTRWQLTAHILAVAHVGHSRNQLRERARAVLEALRDESGETVLLTVPDVRRFVVSEVFESPQPLRIVPHIGTIVPSRGSATSRAMLPYMTGEQQAQLLGGRPDASLLREFAATLERGYSVSAGEVVAGSTNIGAPIIDLDDRPIGAIVLCAPAERVTTERHARFGAMVLEAARSLSRRTSRRRSHAD